MKSFLKEKLSVLPDEDLISLSGAISEFKRVMSKIN